jgi:exodeoxyribonuclease V alpha subunit
MKAFLEESTGAQFNAANNPSPLQDCLVRLVKTYRFKQSSGLFALMRAVQNGDADEASNLLENGKFDDISFKDIHMGKTMFDGLKERIIPYHKHILSLKDAPDKLAALGSFRILSALRTSAFGTQGVNEACMEILREAGMIPRSAVNYEGKPVIITRNDYASGLFNGDIGIIAKDPDNMKRLCAYFRPGEGRSDKFLSGELPEHETAYSMTIHKSQGSESDEILMILPPQQSPVLTRELIYTGITRAKSKLEIWGSLEVFKMAVMTPTKRNSGLKQMLA